jgi:hypothetical protein
VGRPATVAGLAEVTGVAASLVAEALEAKGGTPIDRATGALEAVLVEAPRAETAALILAEAVCSRALGWGLPVPVLATALKPRDLARRGDDLRLAFHRAARAGAGQALALSAHLARAAARLRAAVPQLRANGSGQAVDLFLSQDALAPAALVPKMSDRAARRLCERLVELGVVRELTGRETFRLYGV